MSGIFGGVAPNYVIQASEPHNPREGLLWFNHIEMKIWHNKKWKKIKKFQT